MSKWQERVYKTKYKKIFSELNQAMRSLQDDENLPSMMCNSFDDKCFRDLFTTKIKVAHSCYAAAPNNCQKKSLFLNNLERILSINVNDKWPSFVTLSGYSVKFRYHFKNCSTVDESVLKNEELRNCGWVQIDINGLSAPNVVGKDIFFLSMMQDGFIPFYYGDNKIEDCYKGTGISCSSLYINGGGMEF